MCLVVLDLVKFHCYCCLCPHLDQVQEWGPEVVVLTLNLHC